MTTAPVAVATAVSKVTKIGGWMASLAGELCHWADGQENGGDGLFAICPPNRGKSSLTIDQAAS